MSPSQHALFLLSVERALLDFGLACGLVLFVGVGIVAMAVLIVRSQPPERPPEKPSWPNDDYAWRVTTRTEDDFCE